MKPVRSAAGLTVFLQGSWAFRVMCLIFDWQLTARVSLPSCLRRVCVCEEHHPSLELPCFLELARDRGKSVWNVPFIRRDSWVLFTFYAKEWCYPPIQTTCSLDWQNWAPTCKRVNLDLVSQTAYRPIQNGASMLSLNQQHQNFSQSKGSIPEVTGQESPEQDPNSTRHSPKNQQMGQLNWNGPVVIRETICNDQQKGRSLLAGSQSGA